MTQAIATQHLDVDLGLIESAPINGTAAPVNVGTLPNIPATTHDMLAWMTKKKILGYFRDTAKLGKLSDVIEHWYELEQLLGFQEAVSILAPFLGVLIILTTIRPHQDFR